MVEKLFGVGEETQYAYLKPRLTALAVRLRLSLAGLLMLPLGLQTFGAILFGTGQVILVVDLLVFGWAILRRLFGAASFGILFSGNIVLGVVVFVLYITVGYFGGMAVAVIGLCRFLTLLKQRKSSGHGVSWRKGRLAQRRRRLLRR